MSKSVALNRGRRQIAVRLPDELVSFLDEAVDEGSASSRAEMIIRALERERRRIIAERDIALLQAAGDDDLDGLVKFASSTQLDDLD